MQTYSRITILGKLTLKGPLLQEEDFLNCLSIINHLPILTL